MKMMHKKTVQVFLSLFCIIGVINTPIKATEEENDTELSQEKTYNTQKEIDNFESDEYIEESNEKSREYEISETEEYFDDSILTDSNLNNASNKQTDAINLVDEVIPFLDRTEFESAINEATIMTASSSLNLYFGNTDDYDISKLTLSTTLKNNYDVYYTDDGNTFKVYVLAESGKKIIFPIDCFKFFGKLNYFSGISFSSNIDMSNVKDMSYMFYDNRQLVYLSLNSFNTLNVKNMSHMFDSCTNLKTLYLYSLNTASVEDMSYMFHMCNNLECLEWAEDFNTSNVTDMSDMFGACYELKSLNLKSFDTAKVTNMYNMFCMCRSLRALDVSSFDTSNVSNMGQMFCGAELLKLLDLSNFNTSKVDHMYKMFRFCESLTDLNISTFDTTNVTNMNAMFEYCDSLITVDVSSFDTSNVTDFNNMFYGLKIRRIYASNKFVVPNYCSNTKFMFTNSVVGGKGTNLADKYINYYYPYAHIDGGKENPGLFTCKHAWNDGEETTPATCTTSGIKTYTCASCGETKTEAIKALGHSYTDWEITKNATCTEAGSKEKKCTRCDDKVTEDVAALGHELTHVTKKDATTEDFGNIEYWNCSKCKKNFNDSEGTNEITGSTAIPKLAPSIIKGDNQSVTEKEEKALSVTSNASYDDFIEVKVDGTTLDISKYTKAKGSTIITLNADYVSILSVGTHTLDVVSKFGTATAHFKVEKKVEITPTPETNNSSTTDKTSTGWDDGGPFTTDKCGNVFDRWNNKIYEANGCNVGGYNLVRTSVED